MARKSSRDKTLQRTMDYPRWSGLDIIRFLKIYRKYEDLWNPKHENYLKRSLREDSFHSLIVELTEAGLRIPHDEALRKKIKNLKDVYRSEFIKCKTNAEYKPKLVWFEEAHSFWKIKSSKTQICTSDQSHSSKDSELKFAKRLLSSSSSTLSSSSSNKAGRDVESFRSNRSFRSTPVAKLNEMAEKLSSEDQYSRFTNHVASQLRELPLISFIVLQEKIQSLITQERLAIIEQKEVNKEEEDDDDEKEKGKEEMKFGNNLTE